MPQNPEGWLVRAVVLRSLHLNRSRRRRRGYEGRAGAPRPEFDPCGDASRMLEAQEVAHAIAALLGELPEHLRTVFVLREAEQRDYESIAAVLGVPIGTVRSRLHRARRGAEGRPSCAGVCLTRFGRVGDSQELAIPSARHSPAGRIRPPTMGMGRKADADHKSTFSIVRTRGRITPMILNVLRRLRRDKKGQSLVEYGLLIGGVALIGAAAVSLFGHKTSDIIGAVATILPGAIPTTTLRSMSGHLIETASVGTSGSISLDTATIATEVGQARLGQDAVGGTVGECQRFRRAGR